ncbi:protein ALP1-like [Euphorbia lathyris]|uniref:protein ALP1-like n=1 Tax=Euphorbia lathyris TaxID=212925 RepID=UPI003313F9B6
MRKQLFMRIVEALRNHSEYFQIRCDATGKRGLSPIQKCTAAIRQLAYGAAADQYNEYIIIGESTAIECLEKFCRCVIEIFAPKYLRRPNSEDIQRLLQLHSERHGFPGMLGSIDCMHWKWKNCPVAWKGQFTRGDQGAPTIMLEAVASTDLWIPRPRSTCFWHAFFGVAGSNNDINVLNQSPLFNDVLNGVGPNVQFMVNNNNYTKGYYLADGIYPELATFVKSFSFPEDAKRIKFKQMQEAARKDVERAFGVLQSRWAIVRGPARFWHRDKLSDIMYACIILHNMIVEDEGEGLNNWDDDEGEPPITVNQGSIQNFQQYLQRNAALRDREIHNDLRNDLVEHIWQHFGDSQREN